MKIMKTVLVACAMIMFCNGVATALPAVADTMHLECWAFRIRTAHGGEVGTTVCGISYDNCKYQLMRQYSGATIIDSHRVRRYNTTYGDYRL